MLFAAAILRKAILVSCNQETDAGKANYAYAVVLGVFKLQRNGR